MRIVLWGTYDKGKPRTRILIDALKAPDIELREIHADIWAGVEDKSQISGALGRARHVLRWLFAYPWLIVRYLRAPRHDVVVVGYMGHLDVLVLWPFARLRGVPIVWDVFISLYDTMVLDRRLAGRRGLGPLIRLWEGVACRAADKVVMDTEAHARLLRELYGLRQEQTAAVFVGAEEDVFVPQEMLPATCGRPITLLFYGQFIPLHGIETIVRAAQASVDRHYRWIMIGKGQEAPRIRALLNDGPPLHLEWHEWVPYAELPDWIRRADLCLGIFGATGKAGRVIPNKVFQILSAGKPLVTRDSEAMRELVAKDAPGVYLIPPENPQALLAAVERFRTEHEGLRAWGPALHEELRRQFSRETLAGRWLRIVADAAAADGNTR